MQVFILAPHHRVDVQLQIFPNSVNNQQPASGKIHFFQKKDVILQQSHKVQNLFEHIVTL